MNLVIWIVFIIVFLFLQLPGFFFPFTRDQGAYAYIALRMLDSGFKDLPLDNKPPGIYFLYALVFRLFGVREIAVKILGLFVSFLSVILVYKIISSFYFRSKKDTVFSVFLYIILSSSLWLEVSFVNTEIFLTPLLLMSFYYFSDFFLRKRNIKNIILSGFFLGLSLFIKQVAIATLLSFLFYLLLRMYKGEFGVKVVGYFLVAAFLPVILILSFLFLTKLSLFKCILRNAILLNFNYLQGGFPYLSIGNFLRNILLWFFYVPKPLLWIYFLCIGLLFVVFQKKKINKKVTITFLFSFSLFLSAKMGGLRNFPHYFIPFVSGLCLLYRSLLEASETRRLASFRVLLFLFLVLIYSCQHIEFYLFNPNKAFRKLYPAEADFFWQAKIIGELIKKETKPDDKIFVLGNEPEIYFYARREASLEHINFYFFKNTDDISSSIERLKVDPPQILVISRQIKEEEFRSRFFSHRIYREIFKSPIYEVYKRK